jgi:hypothetical protein
VTSSNAWTLAAPSALRGSAACIRVRSVGAGGFVYEKLVGGKWVAVTGERAGQEIALRLGKQPLLKIYAVSAVVIVLFGILIHPVAAFLCLVASVAGALPFHIWSQARRSISFEYDSSHPGLQSRAALAGVAGRWLSSTSALWHVYYAAPNRDHRRNAGAETLASRSRTVSQAWRPAQFTINVEAWSVWTGGRRILFLPDALVVWEGTWFGFFSYAELTVRAGDTRFVEEQHSIPVDARQVGSTWKFVRNDGGPDLRFKNNAQLAVMEYGELEIGFPRLGHRVVLQTSNRQAAHEAAAALGQLMRG